MNFFVKFLFKIGLKINFRSLTPYLKVGAAYFRYYSTLLFNLNLSSSRNIILICGLPKSGTTWLESLLSLDGRFNNLMPYDVIKWEQNYGRSDNYIPKYDFLKKIPNGNWIIKIHATCSNELLEIINNYNLKPIILHRNIHEVLDSHSHYVDNTFFHPDFSKIKNLNKSQKISFYTQKYFDDYEIWVNKWKNQKHTYNLTYDDLLSDTEHEVTSILKFLEIDISNVMIRRIIEKNSIDKLRSKSIQKEFFRGAKLKK